MQHLQSNTLFFSMAATFQQMCVLRRGSIQMMVMLLLISAALCQVSKPHVSDEEHAKLAGANRFLETDIVRCGHYARSPFPFPDTILSIISTHLPLLPLIVFAVWKSTYFVLMPARSTRTQCVLTACTTCGQLRWTPVCTPPPACSTSTPTG